MHKRAHPRHYRSEYVRGYLHRQADVYSLPGWSQLVIPYIYRVNEKTTNTTETTNTTVGERLCYEYFSIKLSEVVSVVLVVFVVFKISNELLVLKSQTGYW